MDRPRTHLHSSLALYAVCSCTLLFATSCSSKARPQNCKPPPIELFLQGEKDLNPNAKGQAMPVEVRVLLLRSREIFDTLDFETLWRRADDVLQNDLIKATSLTAFPGQLKIYPVKNTKDVAHIALVGIFRQPQGNEWKLVTDVRRQNAGCATAESLHTVVHAQLLDNRIIEADPNAIPDKADTPKSAGQTR